MRRAAAAAVVGLLAFAALAPVPALASAAEEAELLSLVNGLRASRGLRPAVVHAELRTLADEWALRMAAARDIFHSPLDQRVRADWVRLGENVAVDVSVAAAERALEASPDHLANLVNPVYDYVGIGVAHGTDGGVYVVQEFMQLASGPPRQPAQAQPLPAAPKKAVAAPVRRGPIPPPPRLVPSARRLPPPPRPPAVPQPRLPSARLTDIRRASYERRRSGSRRTAYARDTSRNAAPRSSPEISGWYRRASCRYARLISSAPAPGATPRTS